MQRICQRYDLLNTCTQMAMNPVTKNKQRDFINQPLIFNNPNRKVLKN